MRLLLFLKNLVNPLPIKPLSYGEFARKNPNATRQERRAAVKTFLDSTR